MNSTNIKLGKQENYIINSKSSPFLVAIFILECFALPAQFYLLVSSSELTWLEALVRLFSFFTVLTNTLVAICCGVMLLGTTGRVFSFFNRNTTVTAITVYILIVGLVYNIILRPLQDLEGLHAITTEIFHSIVPILFLLFWATQVPKQKLSFKWIGFWLIYPLLYMMYTVIHGAYTGFYPYSFINVSKLGYAKALQNGLWVLLAVILVSLIFIGAGNIQTKKRKT